MLHGTALQRSMLVLALALVAPMGAAAQVGWGLSAGPSMPAGTFDEYFELGVTVGAEVQYPLQERFVLVFNADYDKFNQHPYFGTPNMNLWRLQAGVLADLVGGGPGDAVAIEARLSAGGANLRNQGRPFYLEASTTGGAIGVGPTAEELTPRDFEKTSLTGSGALRLRFGGDSRLTGFVGLSAFWAGLGKEDTEVLRLTEPSELDPLGSAMGYALTMGFTMAP